MIVSRAADYCMSQLILDSMCFRVLNGLDECNDVVCLKTSASNLSQTGVLVPHFVQTSPVGEDLGSFARRGGQLAAHQNPIRSICSHLMMVCAIWLMCHFRDSLANE